MNYCIVQYIESIYKEYISKKKTTYLCLPALSKLKKQTNKNVSCDTVIAGDEGKLVRMSEECTTFHLGLGSNKKIRQLQTAGHNPLLSSEN